MWGHEDRAWGRRGGIWSPDEAGHPSVQLEVSLNWILSLRASALGGALGGIIYGFYSISSTPPTHVSLQQCGRDLQPECPGDTLEPKGQKHKPVTPEA